jgi:hypothetical protein
MPVYYSKDPEALAVFHTSWDCEEGQKIEEENLEILLTDHELCETCDKIESRDEPSSRGQRRIPQA